MTHTEGCVRIYLTSYGLETDARETEQRQRLPLPAPLRRQLHDALCQMDQNVALLGAYLWRRLAGLLGEARREMVALGVHLFVLEAARLGLALLLPEGGDNGDGGGHAAPCPRRQAPPDGGACLVVRT